MIISRLLEKIMANVVSWFDIPVSDMARAVRFYEAVTQKKLERMKVTEGKETALLGDDGCLFQAPEDKPSHFGSRVYLNAEPSIDDALKRVEAAGGKTLVPRTSADGHGYFAYFEDTEGNRVGLHAQQ